MRPQPRGTAERHGRLWGARAADWAEQEVREGARYDAAIGRLGIEAGHAVLDVGCGSGVFLAKAAARGARVSGLDASEPLIEIARGRVPGADLRVGDLQSLPYADDSFDLVAGFNAFFFAADMTAALREARRVARPGAAVLVQVWGRPDRCDLTPALRGHPRAAPGARGRCRAPGAALGARRSRGGRRARRSDAAGCPRPPGRGRVRRRGDPRPPAAVARRRRRGDRERGRGGGHAGDRRGARLPRGAGGAYRLENEWHYLIATA